MRRQKRDRMTRAHSRGYNAGLEGRSRDLCPYNSPDVRENWLNGWREARIASVGGTQL